MPSHHVTRKLVLTAAATIGVAMPSVAGCSSADATPAHTRYVVLTSGMYHGTLWRLFAWEQQSELCMEVLPDGVDPGHPSAHPSWPAAGGGGCGFNAHDPGSGYYASSTGPAGSSFSFGPLPPSATRIRTATHEVLGTRQFTPGMGLPSGRYWINLMPAAWPDKSEGTALDTPQPLDAHGQKVPFKDF